MTPDERQLLSEFLSDLGRTRGVAKDEDAAALIDQAVRANPDAAYVLVQHALLADQALHAAQAQIADLQRQVSPPQPQPSFLGGAGLGPRAGQPQSPASPWAQAAQAQGQLRGQAQGQAQPGGFFGQGGGGLGSFLRTAGTTAAGVAGGEFLFSGLSNLFGGHGGAGFGGAGFGGGGFGGGGFGGGGFGGAPTENVVINNYGDDAGGGYDDGGGYDADNGDPGGDSYS